MPLYNQGNLALLRAYLASTFQATRFGERFVQSPDGDPGDSLKVLTFCVRKDAVQDLPLALDTPQGRLMMEFAQPELVAASRVGPPRAVGESTYLHWLNTKEGQQSAASAVFGLEADAGRPAQARKMSLRQVTLSFDAPAHTCSGTVLPDPSLTMILHGDVAVTGVASILDWAGLSAAMALPLR